MADSASEVDLESDASSVDGLSARDQQLKCDQLQRRVDLLQHENRVLKTEVETLKLKVRSLTEVNQQLRRNSVSIQAKAEQEEEYISNMLQRRISELKKEKEALALNYEQEEECLTNELNRKLVQLQREKELLERTLAQEQETQVNKLKHRIEKLENEKNIKQQSLDKLRHEKIELENALEQEQEALVNRLWKKMDKLEAEKRRLQEKLESASAPLSGSSSIQNLASGGGVGGTSGGVGSGASHSASICLSNVCLGTSSFPSMGPRSANSCTGSLRGSLRIHPSSTFQSDPSPTAADGGPSVVEPGGQMNNISPCSFPAGGDATTAAAARQTSSQRPKPPQSPMDFESSGAASSMNLGLVVSMSKSEYSLPTPSTRAHRGSHSNSFSAAPGVGTFQPSYVPPPPPLDTQSGALYVARLREEVTRLRALVAANQSDQLARAGTYEREERLAAEENLRLRRLLQAEMDRKEALSRQLSGSESSLEMEDERQFNEASRTCQQRGRFRTTSDSLPSPYHPAALFGPGGSLYGPGHAFASAVAAANCGSHSGSPRYCRECNQPIPSLSVNAAAGGVTQQPSRTTVAGNVQQLSRPAGTPSAPQVSNSLSIGGGGSERFAKPVSRPAHSHSTSSCCTTPPGAPMVVRSPYRCGDKGPPRTFDPSKETPPGGAEEDDDFGDDEDDRCPTPPGSSSVSALK
uniref:Coiled-coil domain-containing protein 6 n=1 Tax=Schistocephalus solidus TaxID=70667 RepID=A0A0V0JAC7_SCHSO